MTVGSLFTGIGGFDEGFEAAGYEVLWQVEKDAFCLDYLKHRWPHIPKYEDVHHVGRHNLERVDVIIAGFPCQPFSVAGKRSGASDDRYLWPETLRVIDELNPLWFIGENVPGITSMEQPAGILGVESEQLSMFEDENSGAPHERILYRSERIAGRVISDLEGIDYEFPRTQTGEPVILSIPAAGVDAPHQRDRIFFVANASEPRRRQSRHHGRKQATGAGKLNGTARATQRPGSVANTDEGRQLQSPGRQQEGRRGPGQRGEDVSHANSGQRQRAQDEIQARGNEPDPGSQGDVSDTKHGGRRGGHEEWQESEATMPCSQAATDADSRGRRLGPHYIEREGTSYKLERSSAWANTKVQLRSGRVTSYPNVARFPEREEFYTDTAAEFEAAQRGYYNEGEPSIWLPEPPVGRLVDGLPHRRNLVRAFGNAVVPPQAFQIAYFIKEVERTYENENHPG